MKSLFKILPLLLLTLIFLNSSSVNSTGDGDCKKYEAIFLRGSGQSVEDNKDFKAFKEALEKNVSVDLDFMDLNYPAVSITNFSTILSTYISAGESYEFGESVEAGIEDLKNHISVESKKCPEKKFILGGYSQGAMVVSKALPNLSAEKILYAGTFGDPKLYLPEGKDAKNTACKNIGLSNYRVYVPDCEVVEGVLTALNPYQQPAFRDKLGAFCNANDFMCGSDLYLLNPLKAHLSYDSVNGYEKFAKIVAQKISGTPAKNPEKVEATYSETSPKDIAVLFDFSQFGVPGQSFKYSISDELKEKLVELGNKGARIAFYNVYSVLNQVEPLKLIADFTTNDIEKTVEKLNDLNQDFTRYNFATGNNNVYYALSKIASEASWRTSAEKNIFLISNAYYSINKVSFDGTDYEKALNVLRENRVKLSVLSENRGEENFINEALSNGTGGVLVGNDLSKIKYAKNRATYNLEAKIFSKKFELEDEITLVVVNDVVYGLSREKEITVIGLNEARENSIVLVGFNSSGKRTSKKIYNFSPSSVGVPDCGIAN